MILARQNIFVFESIEDQPQILADSITLETARSLGIGLSGHGREEVVVSVLLRIADIRRVAQCIVGSNFEGAPYRSFFKAIAVENSLGGVRIKGMALVMPPDPMIYLEGQGNGVRKWLAERVTEIEIAPSHVRLPDPEDYGRVEFKIL
ncbi:MAG: hypothetical protein U1F26_05350 [Lysobacterales bacterium]